MPLFLHSPVTDLWYWYGWGDMEESIREICHRMCDRVIWDSLGRVLLFEKRSVVSEFVLMMSWVVRYKAYVALHIWVDVTSFLSVLLPHSSIVGLVVY